MDECILCHESLNDGQKTVTLGLKGSQGLNKASAARGDDIVVHAGQTVHTTCRLNYTNANSISSFKRKSIENMDAHSSQALRSDSTFNFSRDCLFCGTTTKKSTSSKVLVPCNANVFHVRTIGIQKTILEECKRRCDMWSETVLARIEYGQDLVAVGAMYHQECSVNFRTGKDIPKTFKCDETISSLGKRQKCGRPSDVERRFAFTHVTKYLEDNDEEQNTVNDMVDKMKDFLQGTGCEPYSVKYMKQCLIDNYGEKITITEINGRSNVVTFTSAASGILQHNYSLPKPDDTEAQKMRLIQTAAKLIKNDIKSIEVQHDEYPSCEDMTSVQKAIDYLPSTLKLFLQSLFVGKDIDRKIASIGQAIMQSVLPRVIVAPLQIGLGVQMHRQFGSRFLIDSLHQHGFCSSYPEIQKYERSAAVHRGTDLPGLKSDTFVQYIADNVDHNIRTLDGLNTFHGMGIIATTTPGNQSSKAVPRVNVTAEDIADVGRISIAFYKPQINGMDSLKYGQIPSFLVQDETCNADLLWKTSWLLRPQRPSWNGFMQMIQHGPHPGKSSVHFMPMIDLKSTDETCVYSTMCFVSDQAKHYNNTPVLTFDQPLWWKAFEIQQNMPQSSLVRNIVLRLGGLHVEMSFLGSIGHIMGGSGIEAVLETIYAETAVGHMLSGKAISRAVRGHILIEAVLNAMLLSRIYVIPLPNTQLETLETDPPQWPNTLNKEQDHKMEDNDNFNSSDVNLDLDNMDITEGSLENRLPRRTADCNGQEENISEVQNDLKLAGKILEDLITGKEDMSVVCSEYVLRCIQDKLDELKKGVHNLRTSKLWMQYLEMVEILRTFIKAERTGNWALHLHALSAMLPYFAATGHHLYSKSVYLYLQTMANLTETHPDVAKHFENGKHVVRRSDRYWAGLSTDLVIEQMLMRSLKTSGGLTRGRGMTEMQRTIWLLSTPACADVNQAMQEFTKVTYSSSEQHKETSNARQVRDDRDMKTLLEFLEARNPFNDDPSLCSISSGVTADETVNVDNAREVGDQILKSMIGKNVEEFSFVKKHQVVSLNSKISIKVDSEKIQVDPQLLFQRIITVSRGALSPEEVKDLFTYELCTHPAALFDPDGMIRAANKPQLAEALWDYLDIKDTVIQKENVHYVLDGGSLLQRIQWPRGITYKAICELYIKYIDSKYGKEVTVIFDGYTDEPSTKDTAHRRRNLGHIGKTINFVSDMTMNMKKEMFLGNSTNKQRFIHMLSDQIQANGIQTYHAEGDADLLIATTAVKYALTTPTVVIGDDTDLLILLCYHANVESHPIYLKPEIRKTMKTRIKIWDINKTKQKLGGNLCKDILFIHAVLGCDTTSRIFGLGKGVSLKKYTTSNWFRECASIFEKGDDEANDDIVQSGENALVIMYGGKPEDKLDSLRLMKFFQKVAGSVKCVTPETIPPTSAAMKFHSLRVYHQVQVWKGRRDILPENWGWKVVNGKLAAVQTDKPPAPENLLKVIRCKCKSDCHTTRCTCKKHGLPCSLMCGECKGVSCLNSPQIDPEERITQ